MPCVQVGGSGLPVETVETTMCCKREVGGDVNEAWNGYSWKWWIKQDDRSCSFFVTCWQKLSPLFINLFSSWPSIVLLLLDSVGVLLSDFFLKCFTILRCHYLPTFLSSLPLWCVILKDMCGITIRRVLCLEWVCQRGVSLVWRRAIKQAHAHWGPCSR